MEKISAPVHICIVSGQTAPSFLPMLQPNLSPAAVSLLISNKALVDRQLNGLKAAVQLLARADARQIEVKDYEALPDTGYSAVRDWFESTLRQIRERHPASTLVFNASGGQKPMIAAIQETLRRDDNCVTMYCDTDHNRIDYFSQGMPPERLQRALTVEHLLLLQSFRIGAAQSDSENWRKRTLELRLRWRPNAASSAASGARGHVRHAISKDLEQFAYALVSEMSPHDVRGGVTFEALHSGREVPIANEIDVMAAYNSRLLLVECKSGMPSAEDLHKLSSLVRDLGLFTTGVMVTNQSIGNRQLAARARHLGLHFFDGPRLIASPPADGFQEFLQRWRKGSVPRRV
jgi:hypothetical protein